MAHKIPVVFTSVLIILLLSSSPAGAQTTVDKPALSQGQDNEQVGNYVFTMDVLTDQHQANLSMVVTGKAFHIAEYFNDLGLNLNFDGELGFQNEGLTRLTYTLNTTEKLEPPDGNSKNIRWIEKKYSSSIKIAEGTPIVIYKTADRVYQVKIIAYKNP